MDFQWQADHALKVAYLDIAHYESEGRRPGCVRRGIATPCIYGYLWVSIHGLFHLPLLFHSVMCQTTGYFSSLYILIK